MSCCLKKKGKKKSQGDIKETGRASTQGTEDVEADYIRTTFDPQDETQNESRPENCRRALMPPSHIARDSETEELEDAEPFGRSHQDLKKPLKQKHPLNRNSQNEENLYMHLIPETRQGNETSNLTTKTSKCSRQKKQETRVIKPGSSAISRETNKPTSPRTDARPSSVAYVNGNLAKLYSNVR